MIYQITKLIRYIYANGFAKTYNKVLSKFLLNKKYNFANNIWYNSSQIKQTNKKIVAVIGCGNFTFSNICYFLKNYQREFLHSTFDINIDKAITTCKYYNGILATSDIKQILQNKEIKLAYIASNHSTHADYAVKLMKYGKHVHIEKPHVVSNKQLSLLMNEYAKKNSKIFLGFNRNQTKYTHLITDLIREEKGKTIINWFVIGHKINDNNWYYNKDEGGRILGNLCHWSDLTLNLIGLNNSFPCKVIPISESTDKSNFVLNLIFPDKSYAVISFSSLGEVIDGVKESLRLQKGNLLIYLEDFKTLKYFKKDTVKEIKLKKKQLGHKQNIVNSYVSTISNKEGETDEYIYKTAKLFLGIKEAFENNKTTIIE